MSCHDTSVNTSKMSSNALRFGFFIDKINFVISHIKRVIKSTGCSEHASDNRKHKIHCMATRKCSEGLCLR